MIHSKSFGRKTSCCTICFGPNPHYSTAFQGPFCKALFLLLCVQIVGLVGLRYSHSGPTKINVKRSRRMRVSRHWDRWNILVDLHKRKRTFFETFPSHKILGHMAKHEAAKRTRRPKLSGQETATHDQQVVTELTLSPKKGVHGICAQGLIVRPLASS